MTITVATLTRRFWVLLLAGILGCGGAGYPPSLQYPLRTDPIIPATAVPRDDKGGGSLSVPDPPGTFPVMSMAQMQQPGYPLYAIRDKALDPRNLPADLRRNLETLLRAVYGTPARPKVDVPWVGEEPAEGWADVAPVLQEAQDKLKLDEQTLRRGSRLYRLHCLHCHGLTGDGRGPTAFWVNPHPRDYRLGKFKFTSTVPGGIVRPQRADLVRTLRVGIEGTAMPAFNTLPDDELEAMASYVIHLSLRGDVERELMTSILGPAKLQAADFDEEARKAITGFTRQWLNAQDKTIKPVDYSLRDEKGFADSVLRGEKYWREWQCHVCHGDYGRQASFSYDDWGTLARPANLTTGIYRGGRRPLDLYWRVYGGVPGTAMADNSSRPGDQIWDLVNFLQVLPYRTMREKYGVRSPDLPPPKAEETKAKGDAAPDKKPEKK